MNLIRNVMNRLCTANAKVELISDMNSLLASACTDKLRNLTEALLDLLLYFVYELGSQVCVLFMCMKLLFIGKQDNEFHFSTFRFPPHYMKCWIKNSAKICLHGCVLARIVELKFQLVHFWFAFMVFSPVGESFWLIRLHSFIRRITLPFSLKTGNFVRFLYRIIRFTLFNFFSNCCRVFVLLSYLGRKSIMFGGNQNNVIEHILQALLVELLPLADTTMQGFVRGKLDLHLLAWLLMFFLQCVEVLPSPRSVPSEDGDSSDKDSGTCFLICILVLVFCSLILKMFRL